MKNTINISLGGIVFHIEEDAHQKLSAYLDAISKSMQGSEGQAEIMTDIEARIAEILQPKVTDFKQVISITDIEEVIGIMGNPEEFATGSAETKKEQTYSNTNERGRYQYGQRRIFRDPDDKVLGGVCSGIAYHFGVDPIWIRLGFGLSIFLGGFGFLLYILLLIIIPKALTAAEKLEMRGEPVDVNNIRKIIEEDMQDFKKKAQDFGNNVKNWKTRHHGQQFGKNFGDFLSSFFHGLGSLIGGIVKGIFAFIGIILVIVLSCLLLTFAIALFTGINVLDIDSHSGHSVHYSMHTLLSALSINWAERTMLITGIFLFIGIPLLSLIIRFGRAITGRKRPFQWYTVSASILWTAAWIFIIIGVAKVSKYFKVSAHTSNEVRFMLPASANTLYVKMPTQNDEDEENISIGINSHSFYATDDSVFFGSPSICIGASADSNFHFILNKSGRGTNMTEANASANSIGYSFAQHDTVLQLSSYYQIAEGTPWRAQQLEGVLQIPLNKTIDMPEGIDHLICPAVHHKHHHLGGHKWLMTAQGLQADSTSFHKN